MANDKWIIEQIEGSKKVIEHDDFVNPITFIGGIDISFVDQNEGILEYDAVGALVIIDFTTMCLVYSDCIELKTTIPYIPGFLGFREEPYARTLFDRLKEAAPQFIPQILVVDGCGKYHPRGYGSACQIGISLNIPTIGVSKSFLKLEGLDESTFIIEDWEKASSCYELPVFNTFQGQVATALYTGKSKHPRCYVSVGHKISLSTSVEVIKKCSISKIPEPIRQADLISRDHIRKMKDAKKL